MATERGSRSAAASNEMSSGSLGGINTLGLPSSSENNLLMTPGCRVVYPLLKGALEVRNRFCAAPKLHTFTKVIATPAADTTLAARDADFKGNAVADVEA